MEQVKHLPRDASGFSHFASEKYPVGNLLGALTKRRRFTVMVSLLGRSGGFVAFRTFHRFRPGKQRPGLTRRRLTNGLDVLSSSCELEKGPLEAIFQTTYYILCDFVLAPTGASRRILIEHLSRVDRVVAFRIERNTATTAMRQCSANLCPALYSAKRVIFECN